MRHVLSIGCLFLAVTMAFPQQAQWAKAYSGSNREIPTAFCVTEEGDVLVLGYALPLTTTFLDNVNIWLMKISPKGMDTERWFFDSQNPGADSKYDNLEIAPILRRVEDGGYIAAGSIRSRWFSGNSLREYHCAFFVKFSPDLQIEWQRFLGDDDWQTREAINDLVVTADGGFMAAGSTSTFGMGGKDFWLVKLDSEGEMVWQKAYGGPEDDEARLLAQAEDGGFWVAGVTGSFPEEEAEFSRIQPQSKEDDRHGPQDPSERTWVLRVTSEGAVVWQKAYTWGDRDLIRSLQLAPDDGCFLAGETTEDREEETLPDTDILLVRLDSEGGEVWQRAFGGEDSERIISMIPKGEDKYLALGEWKSGEDQDICLMQISKTGHLDWVTLFGTESVEGEMSLEYGGAIAWTAAGEIQVVGSTGRLGPEPDDAILLRFTEEGLISNCEFSRAIEPFSFRGIWAQLEDTSVEFTAAEVLPVLLSFDLTSVPVQVVRDVCAAKKNLVRR